MYNLHMATKIKKQLKKQRQNHMKQRQYLQAYSNQIQPKLLDNYNKRINTFLRKMEQNPVILTQFDENEFAPHKLFRNFNNHKQKCLGSEVFRFKDHNDWNSIYTQSERTQRKNNERYMQQKFGDPSLAYRSIASNSQYISTCKHQYRHRNKQIQINPPMKYVCAVPKIMIRKFQSKQNTIKIKTQPDDNHKNHKQSKGGNNSINRQNKSILSKNSNIDQDNRSVRSFKSLKSFAESISLKNDHQSETNQDNEQQAHQKQKKMYMSPKMHFKTLVQAFEKSTDPKTKQSMKQVLVKCKVFRIKDKKAIQQAQFDKLSFEIDNTISTNNNSGKNGVAMVMK